MKILVCVKQVPDTDKIKIDEKTGTMIRAGVPSILNPFCEYALDAAVELKQKIDTLEIVALTMGPAQAGQVLQRCLELGADRAYHVCDPKFAGSDCLATARILQQAILKHEADFDLIFCGKQAIDGDTAQVPSELAELMGIAQVNYAAQIEEVTVESAVIKSEIENGYEIKQGFFPLLLTMSSGSNYRRFPSLQDVLTACRKKIGKITFQDLAIDQSRIGVKGSPTRVVKIQVPQYKHHGLIIYAEDGIEKSAGRLIDFMLAHMPALQE